MQHPLERKDNGCPSGGGLEQSSFSDPSCSACGLTSCPMAGSREDLESPDLRRGFPLVAWASACFVLPVLVAVFAAGLGDSPTNSVGLGLLGFLGSAAAVAVLAPKPLKE